MVKMQHRDRREGGITVGDPPARYQLDSEGTIEVTEEHAKMLAGTGMWAVPGSWPAPAAPVAAAVPGAGRAPRTREQLEAAARAEGFGAPEVTPPAPQPAPQPTPVVAAPPLASEEGPTIEVSPDMPLEQLRGVAQQLGLKVPRRISQAQLFELIKAQGEQA